MSPRRATSARRRSVLACLLGALLLAVVGCQERPPRATGTAQTTGSPQTSDPPEHIVISADVALDRYFETLDSLIPLDPSLSNEPAAEHLLVRANPWLIERLEATDYYRMKDRGQISLEPRSELALRAGDSLRIPDARLREALKDTFAHTTLDVNVPEFRLRILEFGRIRHTFPVRVGQNRTRYLEMAGTEVDLRTRTGRGTIVRINRDPDYVNPVDNHRYEETRRDDGTVTGLPRIPFLEPEIDGVRHGQLIHPTTNPETLGRASSNGCVGTGEAAAWRIYYSAPLGTEVVVRYDRTVVDQAGDTVTLPDIYDSEPPIWTRTSTATAPSGSEISGFTSSSAMRGCLSPS